MIAMYKEWSFQLYPTFAFEDVISKVSTFGGKGVVRSEIEALRSQECSRYMVRCTYDVCDTAYFESIIR